MEQRELVDQHNNGGRRVVLNQGQVEEQKEPVPPSPPPPGVPHKWTLKKIRIVDTPAGLKEWNENKHNPDFFKRKLGILMFQCGDCALQFPNRHQLVQHKRKGHPPEIPPNSGASGR